MKIEAHNRLILIVATVLVLTLVFAVLLLLASFSLWAERTVDFLIIVAAFAFSLISAVSAVVVMFVQFARSFYDLSLEEAWEFVYRVVFGLPQRPPKNPTLQIREGKVDLDGPQVLRKIGGPGFLGISYDSAVVTCRAGRLYRVLGPGFHEVKAFEKVWDVVDLRPQRRKVKVQFMTRDGIPVSCEADISFRVAGPPLIGEDPDDYPNGYPFDEEAVLKLTTSNRVKARKGNGRIQDWTQRISFGTLDGKIRDYLEAYRFDEFLDPQKPVLSIKTLEQRIEAAVRESGHGMGLEVERVQLGPVLPLDEAISRQWLEFWQAELQQPVEASMAESEADLTRVIEEARVEAKASLITNMLERVRGKHTDGLNIPPDLIMLSFIDVLRTMAAKDPVVQQVVFRQAENLELMMESVQKSPSSSEEETSEEHPKLTG